MRGHREPPGCDAANLEQGCVILMSRRGHRSRHRPVSLNDPELQQEVIEQHGGLPGVKNLGNLEASLAQGNRMKL